MTKEEILDYVSQTPENTNRMVLSDMLDEFSSGSSSGGLVVHETESSGVYTLDKTWKEIYDAMAEGTPVVIIRANDFVLTVSACGYDPDDEGYVVMTSMNWGYGADLQTDYPAHYNGPM